MAAQATAERLVEARSFGEHVLAQVEEVMGPKHPQTARVLVNLMYVAYVGGDLRAARELAAKARGLHEAAQGPDHPETLVTAGTLGQVELELGDVRSARRHLEVAAKLWADGQGERNPDYAGLRSGYARLLVETGRLDGAAGSGARR